MIASTRGVGPPRPRLLPQDSPRRGGGGGHRGEQRERRRHGQRPGPVYRRRRRADGDLHSPRRSKGAEHSRARLASGRALVFFDADTRLPPWLSSGLRSWSTSRNTRRGSLASARPGRRPAGPLLVGFLERRAAAPPAAGQGDAGLHVLHPEAFDEFGPLDQRVAIGEEWPILAGLYRARAADSSTIKPSRRLARASDGAPAVRLHADVRPVRLGDPELPGPRQLSRPRPARAAGLDPRRLKEGGRRTVLRTTDDGETCWPGFGRWPAWLGPWLGKLRLHAIEPRQAPGRPPTIAKRRRWFGPLLIGPGNLYLRLLGSGVRVLPGAEWRARERALHRAFTGSSWRPAPGAG